jgi:hypothetical protein
LVVLMRDADQLMALLVALMVPKADVMCWW